MVVTLHGFLSVGDFTKISASLAGCRVHAVWSVFAGQLSNGDEAVRSS